MTSGQRSIDCDVHVAPTVAALMPYFSDFWRDSLEQAGFIQPRGVAYTYPAIYELVATKPEDATLETIRREVLGRSSHAILNAYWGIESMPHPYQARAVASAINDWLRAEWLDRDERLLGSAVVVPQAAPLAVEEIERIAGDRRFVQILVPARAEDPYGNHRYWPIWRAAADHDLAVAITFGGSSMSSPTPVGWTSSYFEHYVLSVNHFQAQLGSMITAGLFEELPTLRVTILESGWTWLPAVLWRMDREWKALRRETPWVKEPPSSYVRRHVRFTTAPLDAPPDDAVLADILEQLGSDELLLHATDFPHRHDPEAPDVLRTAGEELARHILWDNAAAHYGLESRVPVRT